MASAAPIRAKVNTNGAINARVHRLIDVVTSMPQQRLRICRLRDGLRCLTNGNIPCLFLTNLALDELDA
jgi:hypothetical protein